MTQLNTELMQVQLFTREFKVFYISKQCVFVMALGKVFSGEDRTGRKGKASAQLPRAGGLWGREPGQSFTP